MEESKKELLQSIVKERLEDLELINEAGNNLTFWYALKCVKQYEKHLQDEKNKITSIAYKQEQILNQLNNSKNLFTF